jgi:hypothetical protein
VPLALRVEQVQHAAQNVRNRLATRVAQQAGLPVHSAVLHAAVELAASHAAAPHAEPDRVWIHAAQAPDETRVAVSPPAAPVAIHSAVARRQELGVTPFWDAELADRGALHCVVLALAEPRFGEEFQGAFHSVAAPPVGPAIQGGG